MQPGPSTLQEHAAGEGVPLHAGPPERSRLPDAPQPNARPSVAEQGQAAGEDTSRYTASLEGGPSPDAAQEQADRQRWMAVLARAPAAALQELLGTASLPTHVRLRGPEAGLVMLRGRQGGEGARFNLGEVAVTRCTVRAGDRLGHATVLGRDAAQAELAARLDAALQDPAHRPALLDSVIAPLAARQQAAREADAARAAATRVQFFTLATMRGDAAPAAMRA